MPVHSVKKNGKVVGYQFGDTGKVYKNKADAYKQERAIRASGWKEKNVPTSMSVRKKSYKNEYSF